MVAGLSGGVPLPMAIGVGGSGRANAALCPLVLYHGAWWPCGRVAGAVLEAGGHRAPAARN